MLWEFLEWAGPPVALGILSNLLTPYARRALKKYLDKTRTLCTRLVSKISTSFKEISFLAVAKRKITTFAQVVVVGLCRLAIFCFWVVIIYFKANQISERANTVRANGATISISTACDCPTPTGGVYRGTIEPEWPTESTPVLDYSPAQKGRKSKRATQPCAVENTSVVIGMGGSRYGMVSNKPR